MIIDRDKARNDYLFSHKPMIELPVATIQHMALYTALLPFEIAIKSIKSIENYNDIRLDTRYGMVKMAEQLVELTRNTDHDNTKA